MAEPTYTCVTCQVMYRDPELHRDHFKSDWHRYNLKRKVADLAVVSLAAFATKKEQHDASTKEEKVEKANTYCVACCKNFKSPKAYENHIQSKKHQEMILKFEAKPAKAPKLDEEAVENEDEEMEEVASDDWEDDAIPLTDCLFCPHHSSTLDKSMKHMTVEHSFFLPDPEFVTSLEGLVEYLGAKVGQGHMCLWCNAAGKRFETREDVQRHMVSKGHCKLLHTGEALVEYDEWYDYSSSYPEGQQGDKDEDVQLDVLDDSEYQLTLPSGATIGHRSLLRYYRQSLSGHHAVVAARANGPRTSGKQLVATYRQLGWTGSCGKEAVRKAKDLGHMRRLQQYHWQRLGSKSNKLWNNIHFKDRNGMC